MTAGAWMRSNLTAQGYCLSDSESRALWLGLRFSTGVCLGLVVAALALESATLIFALAAIGLVAGFTAHHPFDYVWNHAVRHATGGLPLPQSPAPRRHAFKLATGWLLAVGALFAAGAAAVAFVLGALLVAACATVTVTNLCLPSETLAWWERRTASRKEAIST